MSNGRTFEGFDNEGTIHRYVIEQSMLGYAMWLARRKPSRFAWSEPIFLGDFESSQQARESVDVSQYTIQEDWYGQ